jgi:hypothetical protein
MTDQTMLYRPSEDKAKACPEAWGLPLDLLIVDSDQEADARLDGWLSGPEAVAALNPDSAFGSAYDSILDASVSEITPLLAELTAEELSGLLTAERSGKTRKGLVTEIEKAIEAKVAGDA